MSLLSSTSLLSEPLYSTDLYVGGLVSLPLVRCMMSSLFFPINSSSTCFFFSSLCLLTSREGIMRRVKPMAFSLVLCYFKGVVLLLVCRSWGGCSNTAWRIIIFVAQFSGSTSPLSQKNWTQLLLYASVTIILKNTPHSWYSKTLRCSKRSTPDSDNLSSIPEYDGSPFLRNHPWTPKILGGAGGSFDIVFKFQTYIEIKITDKK